MPYNQKNKFMWICCAGLALTVSPAAWAQTGAGPEQAPAVRAASVVRADRRTGRLVRKVVVTPAPETSAAAVDSGEAQPAGSETQTAAVAPQALRKLADDAAGRHGIDPLLVDSVIRVESNYNPLAVSPKGAEGLMQLIPATARRFGATNSFDVRENIEAGVKYLKYLLDMFGDDRLAVAAYNAGESAVMRYGDVPPYRETVNYVSRVGKALGTARQQTPAPPAAIAAPLPEEAGARPVEAYVDSEGRIFMRTR
ncbi:MAG: transglycosylase SLT domain-containing protein [Bryobacteraceae bacterium]|jgi:soluble lytic murein transglycosylase-like protein